MNLAKKLHIYGFLPKNKSEHHKVKEINFSPTPEAQKQWSEIVYSTLAKIKSEPCTFTQKCLDNINKALKNIENTFNISFERTTTGHIPIIGAHAIKSNMKCALENKLKSSIKLVLVVSSDKIPLKEDYENIVSILSLFLNQKDLEPKPVDVCCKTKDSKAEICIKFKMDNNFVDFKLNLCFESWEKSLRHIDQGNKARLKQYPTKKTAERFLQYKQICRCMERFQYVDHTIKAEISAAIMLLRFMNLLDEVKEQFTDEVLVYGVQALVDNGRLTERGINFSIEKNFNSPTLHRI